MGLIVSGKSAVQTEPIPARTYPARCVGVVDLGTQQGKFDDRPKVKVAVIFEIPSVRIEVDGESKTQSSPAENNLLEQIRQIAGQSTGEDERGDLPEI